jgi:tetratricopeptide (TPR) repeat protein
LARRRPRSWPLLVALGLALVGPARADDFWAELAPAPDEARYQTAMDAADELALAAAAQASSDGSHARTLALKAAAAYEEAAAARPGASEPHYRAGLVLYYYFAAAQPDHRAIEQPTLRAIEHWKQFEALAPRDPRLADMYFMRSLAYTQLGGDDNYRLGIADYDSELAIVDGGNDGVDTIVANQAELYMALGEIEDALAGYRRAYELNNNGLFTYGLAVALDRDGQGVKARELLANTARSAGFDPLDKPGVFFIPEGDEFYYRALCQEVLGKYESAANYYQRFLDAQPGSPWVGRARENLAAVKKKLPKTKPESRGHGAREVDI